MSHVSTFKKHLETAFGIALPRDAVFQEQENVIRVYSKTLMMLQQPGYMGFVAGKVSTKGIEVKTEFAQLFLKGAKKNTIQLSEKEARDFVEDDFVPVKEDGKGQKLAKFGRHLLGIGKLEKGKLYSSFIGKGRKRVENQINP